MCECVYFCDCISVNGDFCLDGSALSLHPHLEIEFTVHKTTNIVGESRIPYKYNAFSYVRSFGITYYALIIRSHYLSLSLTHSPALF